MRIHRGATGNMVGRKIAPLNFLAALSVFFVSISVNAELRLTSPLFEDGDILPSDLTCTRKGGDGLSPPLNWSGAPEGTQSFALIEHHYPRGTVEGVDEPSYYWLLWSIPAETTALSRGNKESVGHAGGGTKLSGLQAYVPPCSPEQSGMHTYIITLYALDSETIGLADHDDLEVDWATLTKAIEGKVIDKSSLAFQAGTPRERSAENDSSSD